MTPNLTFHPVTPETWHDFEALFEGRGGPKNCWCMIFRVTTEEARQRDKASRKAAMERRIKAGKSVGILAYLASEPVAWCSVAPKDTYTRLGNDDADDSTQSIWSVACFFVRTKLRDTGVSRQLLDAAIEHARSNGATVIEAYPVDHDSPSYRYCGLVPRFEAMGFKEVGMLGTRRHKMQLELELPSP